MLRSKILPLALTLSTMAAPAFANPPTRGGMGGMRSAPSYHAPVSTPSFHPPMSYTPSAPSYHAPASSPAYHPSAPYAPSAPVAPYAPANHAPVSSPSFHPSVTPAMTPGPVVMNRGGVRYTQGPVIVNNVHMVSRTYYGNGGPVVRNYRPYSWGGNYVYAYHPVHYYSAGYYGWFGTPWYTPVSYDWGYYNGRAEWYGCYSYYYRPYAYYRSPSYWLTDYLIAEMLENEYRERSYEQRQIALANARAAQAEARAQMINEEMKEQIKLQVEEAMRAHQGQQEMPVTAHLNDMRHIYAISTTLNVMTVQTGEVCALSSGDLIRQADQVNQGDQAVNMTVLSSKAGNCATGSIVMISVTDLQEFQNQFNERVENGMEHMKTEFHQE